MSEKNGETNNKQLYALLHVSPEASDEEIRRAYRQWAQVYHPDKHQSPQVLNYLISFYAAKFSIFFYGTCFWVSFFLFFLLCFFPLLNFHSDAIWIFYLSFDAPSSICANNPLIYFVPFPFGLGVLVRLENYVMFSFIYIARGWRMDGLCGWYSLSVIWFKLLLFLRISRYRRKATLRP